MPAAREECNRRLDADAVTTGGVGFSLFPSPKLPPVEVLPFPPFPFPLLPFPPLLPPPPFFDPVLVGVDEDCTLVDDWLAGESVGERVGELEPVEGPGEPVSVLIGPLLLGLLELPVPVDEVDSLEPELVLPEDVDVPELADDCDVLALVAVEPVVEAVEPVVVDDVLKDAESVAVDLDDVQVESVTVDVADVEDKETSVVEVAVVEDVESVVAELAVVEGVEVGTVELAVDDAESVVVERVVEVVELVAVELAIEEDVVDPVETELVVVEDVSLP